ncbi:hypothetical protein J4Q44_G00375450 [Coregonus suidteri]|uniref:PDZ domain-containing protein n=1 Tax=Coregonus suidteri TaxID=861788 RepID=A0AAN8KSW8_9TELE
MKTKELSKQIEEGGKAEQCKKLRVGDELVNINGSALYGSRQEALILIKGSYRILKITVRRRSVPVIRPHSWHLARVSNLGPTHYPGTRQQTTVICLSSGISSPDTTPQTQQFSR